MFHRSGGVWEGGLNDLYETLAAEAHLQPRGHGQLVKAANSAGTPLVLDVGTHIGAFGLFVASLGYHLYAFEMQERIFTLVELSRRVNGYHRMAMFHTALWIGFRSIETGYEVKFTPSVGNFGGTTVMNNVGEVSMRTSRLEEYVPQSAQIFFMKVDVENAEEYVLSGFADTLASGRVKHMVMETRSNRASLVGWFYDIGFSCGLYDNDDGLVIRNTTGVDNHLVVDMATLPILEQMKLARSAGTLIGQHGAALSHGMWMHPNSSLVEVDVQKQCSCYHNIARWNRLRYELRHLSN